MNLQLSIQYINFYIKVYSSEHTDETIVYWENGKTDYYYIRHKSQHTTHIYSVHADVNDVRQHFIIPCELEIVWWDTDTTIIIRILFIRRKMHLKKAIIHMVKTYALTYSEHNVRINKIKKMTKTHSTCIIVIRQLHVWPQSP